jgi:hypothetical protein
MIHIRIDHHDDNSRRQFACGIGPKLPSGDTYFFQCEAAAELRSDCPGCNPGGPKTLGTPISQLSGRPGDPGYEEFCRIAESWGMP